MNTRWLSLMLLVLGCVVMASVHGASTDLIQALTNQLNVTEDQAEGGAGALFGYAKQNLTPDEFSQVAAAVPGIDSLLSKAPALGGGSSGGLLGSAGSLLEGGSGSATGLARLGGSFSQLGMSPELVQKFIPVVLDYVKSTGGEATMKLLQGALLP